VKDAKTGVPVEDAARILATKARTCHDVVQAAIRVDTEMWRRKRDGLDDLLDKLKREKAALNGKTIDGQAVRTTA
jgi:hypothetical protein